MTDTVSSPAMLARLLGPLLPLFSLPRLLLLTLLLLLPALNNTFFGDDFHHYAQLNGHADFLHSDDLSLFNLFSFVDDNPQRRQLLQNHSLLPWWAGEQFSWKFWRPVTELSLYADYVWLRYPPLMHLHSIAWYLALIVLLHRLFCTLFSCQRTALLASALFALNGAHGMLVGWLCSRSPLLACFFAVLTLLLHRRAITAGQPLLQLAALACLALSLLSAEIGLSTTAWLFAWAMFIDRRRLLARLLSLLPYAVLVIVWWSVYKSAGFGVSGSNDFYLEPLSQPAAYLQQLAGHMPTLLFSQWLAIPSDLLGQGPAASVAISGGLASLGLLWLLYRHARQPRLLLFFACGALLSMFPLASTALQDRNVVFVSLGFAGILALAISQLWQSLQQHGSSLRSSALAGLLALHFVLSPLVLLVMEKSPSWLAEPALRRAAALDYLPQQPLVIIGAPAMEVAYLAPSLLYLNGSMPVRLWNLVGNQQDFHIALVDDYTLQLSSSEGLISRPEQFVRDLALEPFQAGDRIDLDGLQIDILAVNTAGQPLQLAYRFARPLAGQQLVRWSRRGYQALTLQDFPLDQPATR